MIAYWLQGGLLLAVLAVWGCVGVVRAAMLYRRGVLVLVADRHRSPARMAGDTIAVAVLGLYVHQALVYSARVVTPSTPGLGYLVLDSPWARAIGAVLVVVAAALYTVAVVQLGSSWRLGVDRDKPGPLVTSGVYAWSRHPIYVAFVLLFLGSFLLLGRLVFLVLLGAMCAVLYAYAIIEERFLAARFGDSYAGYAARVARWVTWPAHRPPDRPQT